MIRMLVQEGIGIIDGRQYEFDASYLTQHNVVYAQWDIGSGFYERDPFVGRESDPDIMAFVQSAATMIQSAHDQAMNPPPMSPQEALELERAGMIVSAFQAFEALDVFGYLDAAEAAIAEADKKSQRAFHKATEFRRDSPTVLAIAASLGISELQLDALFRYAATIEA